MYRWSAAATSIQRTNTNLDKQLVEAAAAVLGTGQTQKPSTPHYVTLSTERRASDSRSEFTDLTPSALLGIRSARKLA